jgi:hypothetical protein
MNKTVLRVLVSTSGLLLALMLAACAPSGITTTTGSQPTSTTAASSAKDTPTATKTTETATTGATSTLPSDIPVYPGAKLSSTGVEDGAKTYLYTTTDTIAKVLNFYKQQMPANGWNEQQENGGVANVLEFTKDPRRAIVSAMVPLPTGDAGLTTFSIAVSG